MKIALLCSTAVLAAFYTHAQPCTYLAYDGFDYPNNAPLHNSSGGTGWASAWEVQNGNIAIPGIQCSANLAALNYNTLQKTGNLLSGGSAYLTIGRKLNTSENGPFSSLIGAGGEGIGSAQNGSLYISAILRKTEFNDEPVFLGLHGDNTSWYFGNNKPKIAFGYFGAASENNGKKYWSVQVNGTTYVTSKIVEPNSSIFVVVGIRFSSLNTEIDCWINPATIGTDTPPTATFLDYFATSFALKSLSVYLGNDANSGYLDEIRLSSSYRCVSPDNNVLVNLPPQAVVNASPISGNSPLLVNFSGAASTDPEGASLKYRWDFGDGSAPAFSQNAQHTYTNIGQITASLTVTDNLALQHTQYQTITIKNANGSFPCQSTFTVQKMPACTTNDGMLAVHVNNNVAFTLKNPAGQALSPNNNNTFNNLAPGAYTFTASGPNGCSDAYTLHLQRDSTSCPGYQADICNMRIGTNLDGFADWSPLRPMRNLMKHVRWQPIPYTSSCNCWSIDSLLDEIKVDSNGYPLFLPQNTTAGNTLLRFVLSSNGANLPPGHDYVLLYDGLGQITVSGSVSNVNATPGRIQFKVNGPDNIWMNWSASQSGNYLRNLRLLRLEDEHADLVAEPFYPGFLDKIAPFHMLRFMDWGATNNNPNVQWSDRTPSSYFTWATPSGVPYETMIDLANKTQKDVWICIPHAADANYIQQMAQLFKTRLNPKLKVYLEYSNEVWNWIFQQAHYNDQNRPNNLNYPRAYAEKAKTSFQIWHNVFGASKARVKRVLGLQTLYNGLNEQILAQLDQNDWDLGAVTYYMGLDHSNAGNPVLNAGSTPQQVVQNARNNWKQNIQGFKQDYNQIHLFGKEIVAYEGGQHFVGNVFGIPYDYQQAMWDAQKSPDIYELYNEVLDSIRNWGCRLAGNFSFASQQESVYGSWGVMPDIDVAQPYLQTAPKYQALLDNNCNKPDISAPKADFNVSASSGCAPMSVQYTAVNSDDNIEQYRWYFPGGVPASSTLPNPTVVYPNGGVFNASLVASNAGGRDSVAQLNILTVLTKPSGNFTTQILGKIGIFTSTTSAGSTISWDFGDGTNSNQANPVHTFSEDGVYAVQLTLTNNCGTTKITKEVTVATNPTASFTYTVASGCAPLTVQFNSTSSNNTQNLNWSFPGGNPLTSTSANPVVVYNNPGSFSASLTASNGVGQNTSTQNGIITVSGVPATYFNTLIEGQTVSFFNATIGGGAYTWYFGDGTTSNLANPVHTYAAEATFTVTLIASNDCGSSMYETKIKITFPPTADFNFTPPGTNCAPYTVQYSSNCSANTTEFNWSFPGGNPSTSTQQNPTVVYELGGIYGASLIASNGVGKDTIQKNNLFEVKGRPITNFTFQIDSIFTVHFNNNTQNASSYNWNFGDGAISTEKNPVHVFTKSGNFLVRLTAINDCGFTFTEILVIITVATHNPHNLSPIQVYPNPNTGHFVIQSDYFEDSGLVEVQLWNALGQRVFQQWALPNQAGQLDIQTNIQIPGVYFLHLKQNNKRFQEVRIQLIP